MADAGFRRASFGNRLLPWLAGVVLGGAVMALGFAAERVAVGSHAQVQRAQVMQALTVLRGRLDGVLSANLLLGQGLADYVAASGTLEDGRFEAIARNLLSHRTEVRHVALIHGTVITAVYPQVGNESVVGLDLREVPDQWPALRQAIEGGMPVVAAPVIPVQGGGAALIVRIPVHAPAPRGQSYRYWGIVSTLIDFAAIMERAGLAGPLDVRIALRLRDWQGMDSPVFFGDAAVLQAAPQEVALPVPGGKWLLAGVPLGGWEEPRATVWALRAGSLSMALFIGWIGGALVGQWGGARRDRALVLSDVRRRDALTGLLDRAGLLVAGDLEFGHARRTGRRLAVLAIDIDRFRRFNVVAGQAAAEEALRGAAGAIAASVRPLDLVGRTGEGAFVVLLAGATSEGAVLVAEKIRRAVAAHGVTASVGVALVMDHDEVLEDTLVRAAERLEAAKLAGRDRIAV